ncbi:hypothetical protein HDV02_001142 [Globomyces sp. JEL0801]|nr:hypothetical protein HDV02_001142 [Globomyces sp. JEL0801]
MFKLLTLSSTAAALAVEIDGDNVRFLEGPWELIFSILSILIGALLIFSGLKFGISLAGFLGGMTVAMMILGIKDEGLIENDTARLIFIIVFGIVGVVLVNIFEKPSLIGGTSLIGSYTLFSGLDYFLRTGFRDTIKGLLTGTDDIGDIEYKSAAVLLMLAGVVVFTGVGVAYQYKTTKDLKYRDS